MSLSRQTICIIAPEFIGPYPNGGVGTACYWEAMSLGDAGYDVTVLYTGATERQTPEYWESHFRATTPIRYIDLTSWAAGTGEDRELGHFDPPAPEARVSELVLRYLRQHRFDAILAQEFQGHGLRALQARQCGDALHGTRVAVTLHGSRHWTCEGMRRLPIEPDRMVDYLEKTSTRLADRVIAPSRSMANWVMSHWGVPSPTVIPYCYDHRGAGPRELVVHEGPFSHLVFFGRLETRKGVQLLVRALAESAVLQRKVERVTFLGKHARIEGIPSDRFLEIELAKVPNIAFEIISDKGSHEAIEWLRSQHGILAVSPSLGDNMPYALIELFTQRIPFVSTRVGGIPDIVGERNDHLLAAATTRGLRDTLERICLDDRLTIDYRDGYDARAATRTHVDFVAGLLAESPTVQHRSETAAIEVVVTDACTPEDVARTRDVCAASDPALLDAKWSTFDCWREAPGNDDVLFVHSTVRPEAGMLARLRRALRESSASAVTSFFWERTGRTGPRRLVAPLGSSVDNGWMRNCFGGPCVLAGSASFPVIREVTSRGFAYWPVYAAMACEGLTLALVPDGLYTVDPKARATTLAQVEAVIRQYHMRRPTDLDWRWLLKGAFSATNGVVAVPVTVGHSSQELPSAAVSPGRALYDRLTWITDDELRGFAELDPGVVARDPFFADFAAIRRRLTPLLARWSAEEPRIYIYGAGLHTRMLLSAFPSLGTYVTGFIDRRSCGDVLGKPCVSPDQFTSDLADVIVYSSREFECEMHAKMASISIEHVLLYHDGPGVAPTTAVSSVDESSDRSSLAHINGTSGRAIYDRLLAVPDEELRGFAELDSSVVIADPFFWDFRAVRRRLCSVLSRWATEKPQVYVCGAGQHTRMLLRAVPELGRFVAGFIDRQAVDTFLGKPCVHPDEFSSLMGDAIVYSSREFEREMFIRMAPTAVEHVLLYHDAPTKVPKADTVTRLQNRFGHRSLGRDGLAALHERRPTWMTGSISGGDTLFLFEMVQAMKPRHVLEIGVASGCSSGGLLYALDHLLPESEPSSLSSFDVLPRCYFDERHATGEAALVMHRDPRTRWTLQTNGMDARAIARAYGRDTFDFAFIDANHCHPWPLLDLLHLTSVVKPESWVVLHDIELPNIRPENTERGALLLFEHWPFNKVHGIAESQNIGAVQLPADPAFLVPMALSLLALPWQWPIHETFMELPPAFAEVEAVLKATLTQEREIAVAV